MNVEQRINILEKLGNYILDAEDEWEETKKRAERANNWFTTDAINRSAESITRNFLDKKVLEKWAEQYQISTENTHPKTIGVVMAGNIPMVGFHDLLCVFISGHKALIKLSGKDDILIRHLSFKMMEWNPECSSNIHFAEMLKGCDAYIATGSNNTARYFESYFGKYPSIIRKNRTSVAILNGTETPEQLTSLADDVCLYFGLGCRNITKLYVPENYDFEPLVRAFDKYLSHADHHKYKNNYDYQLAICIINNKYYMTNGSVLLLEDQQLFSPISQLNYEFYSNKSTLEQELLKNESVQCIVGNGHLPFGWAQSPGITDYADGKDTLNFLLKL